MGQRQSLPRQNYGSDGQLSSVECLHKVCPAAHDLIEDVNEQKQNSLQCAVIDDDNNLAKEFLDITLRRHSVDRMITHVDQDGLNSLQYAIIKGNIRLAETLLAYLSDEVSKHEALSNVDSEGNNCMQLAYLHCNADAAEACVEMFADHLSAAHLSSLILHTNSHGQNILTTAMVAGKLFSVLRLQQNLNETDFLDLAELIMTGEPQPMITWAIEHDDHRLLKVLTASHPSTVKDWLDQNSSLGLSTRQIEIMAPVTDTYIIPVVQTRARRQALVCYSLSEREGAQSEAEELISALEESGFTVHALVWTSYVELRDWLVEVTEVIKDHVSILALFVMCHGNSGTLQGQGSFGQINAIIDETRNGIPPCIPLLVGIQACQISGERSALHRYVDASPAMPDTNEMNHVIFTAKNSVLIMATIHGEFAYRQNFTTAFGEELKLADNTLIYEIFVAAQRRMKADSRDEYRNQWLDFRVVGSSKLRL